MIDFLTALGLVFVIEGLMLAAFPDRVKRLLAVLQASPEAQLRLAGLAAAVMGVGWVWLVRGV